MDHLQTAAIRAEQTRALVVARQAQAAPAQELQLANVDRIGPAIPAHLRGLIGQLAACERVPITILCRLRWNPEYVPAINRAIDALEAVVCDTQALAQMEPRAKALFLARAMQWTTAIRTANKENGRSDFEDGGMLRLQGRLRRAGACEEYGWLVNFFRSIGRVAFKEEELRFPYPSLTVTDQEDAQEVARQGANGILTLEGGRWSLVNAGSNPNQDAVCKALTKLVDAMNVQGPDSPAARLSNEELLYNQALVGQVMTNYVRDIDLCPALSTQVFDLLAELHGLLVARLKADNRGQTGIQMEATGLQHLIGSFDAVMEVLRDEKFQGFYCKDDAVATLKSVEMIVDQFIKFIVSPEKLLREDNPLTILDTDPRKGMHVYLTGKPGDQTRDVVVFVTASNTLWNKVSAAGFGALSAERGTKWGVDGMVLTNVSAAAKALRVHLETILQAKKDSIGPVGTIHLVGAGLDGCAAQLVGFERVKEIKGAKVSVVACGMPAYLDQTAAADMLNRMREMSGLRCVNFVLPNDKNMRNLGFTAPFGLRYEGSPCTWVPVPRAPVFAVEAALKDTLAAYLSVLPSAIRMHMAARRVFVCANQAVTYLDSTTPIAPAARLLEATKGPKIEEQPDGDPESTGGTGVHPVPAVRVGSCIL